MPLRWRMGAVVNQTSFLIKRDLINYVNSPLIERKINPTCLGWLLPLLRFIGLISSSSSFSSWTSGLMLNLENLSSDSGNLFSVRGNLSSVLGNLSSGCGNLSSDRGNLSSNLVNRSADFENLSSDLESITSDLENLFSDPGENSSSVLILVSGSRMIRAPGIYSSCK